MRNFIKLYKKNMLLLLGAIPVYALLISAPALADEYPQEESTAENMNPSSVHNDVYSDDDWEWEEAPLPTMPPPEPDWQQPITIVSIEMWEANLLRIRTILKQDEIMRPLLQSPELQILQSVYNETIETLKTVNEPKNNKIYEIEGASLIIVIENAISLQEFILQSTIKKNIEASDTKLAVILLILAITLVIWLLIITLKCIYERFIQVWI